jgi:tetratricopeptide (TPR) repeat protein
LKETHLNKTDELCELALLIELRSLSQFFEGIKAHSPMVSREQELAMQEALDHVAHKNVPRAIRVLRQVVESEPLNLKGHLLLGTIYLNLRSYPRAIKALSKGREICRQTIKYLLMHADLLEQDGNMQDGQDIVVLLHRIAGIRFYEGLFLSRLVDCLIRTRVYKQAMRLLASWNADDQPTHGL